MKNIMQPNTSMENVEKVSKIFDDILTGKIKPPSLDLIKILDKSIPVEERLKEMSNFAIKESGLITFDDVREKIIEEYNKAAKANLPNVVVNFDHGVTYILAGAKRDSDNPCVQTVAQNGKVIASFSYSLVVNFQRGVEEGLMHLIVDLVNLGSRK